MSDPTPIPTSRLLCETHPDSPWPHFDDMGLDCPGPGVLTFDPHEHVYGRRGFCETCRATAEEVARTRSPIA